MTRDVTSDTRDFDMLVTYAYYSYLRMLLDDVKRYWILIGCVIEETVSGSA